MTRKKTNKNERTVKVRLYKHYNYEYDPAMGEVLDIFKKSKLKKSEAAEESGVAASTISNWENGKTRAPQSRTIEALGRALGYKRTWVRDK